MKGTELLRLVWLNINQNKFKSIMTSIGIVVGAATIVMVIAIGRGGQMDVAEQFSSLNAGAIDVSYEWEGEEESGGFFSGGLSNLFSGGMFGNMFGGRGGGSMPGGGGSSSSGGDSGSGFSGPSGGDFGGMPDMSGFGNMPGRNSEGEDNSDSGDGAAGGFGGMPSMSGGGFPGQGDGSSGEMPDFGDGEGMPDFGDGEGMPDFGDGEEMPDFRDGEGMPDSEEGISGSGKGEGADGSEKPDEMQENESGDEQEALEDGQDNRADVGKTDEEPENVETESETEESLVADRINQENVILTENDVEDIELFVDGITGVTISYSTRSSIEGADLTEAQTYTIAGVKESYGSVSNLELAAGEFLTEADDQAKARVCVLGSSVTKELFGSAEEAYNSKLYIDDRVYTVIGVLETTGTVSAGISPDDAIFVPYETGIKYITGENISPKITVIAQDVNVLDSVISQVESVLAENYSNTEFTFSDAGSKMEAAESSNRILTMLLSAMAVIVFIVGGIGIMNVLFVSVKERTSEIGILKSLGASRSTILLEFLLESAAISLLGGVLGVGISFLITPIVELYDIRVEANAFAWLAALGFAVLTGTIFGFYPAWKASRLVPVEALNAE